LLTKEHVVVISAVQHHEPQAVSLVGEPLGGKLHHVDVRFVPIDQIEKFGNFPKAVFYTLACTGMNPENPGVRG